MDDGQHPVTRAIRERIEAHEGSPAAQWYVGDYVIDCEADEFWAVVDEAVRVSLAAPAEPRTGEWAQNASDGTPTLRAGSVIEAPASLAEEIEAIEARRASGRG